MFFGGPWTNQVLLNIVILLWLVQETDASRVLLAFLFGTQHGHVHLPADGGGPRSRGRADRTAGGPVSSSSVVSCLITLAT